jgi:hypothetical protein
VVLECVVVLEVDVNSKRVCVFGGRRSGCLEVPVGCAVRRNIRYYRDMINHATEHNRTIVLTGRDERTMSLMG